MYDASYYKEDTKLTPHISPMLSFFQWLRRIINFFPGPFGVQSLLTEGSPSGTIVIVARMDVSGFFIV